MAASGCIGGGGGGSGGVMAEPPCVVSPRNREKAIDLAVKLGTMKSNVEGCAAKYQGYVKELRQLLLPRRPPIADERTREQIVELVDTMDRFFACKTAGTWRPFAACILACLGEDDDSAAAICKTSADAMMKATVAAQEGTRPSDYKRPLMLGDGPGAKAAATKKAKRQEREDALKREFEDESTTHSALEAKEELDDHAASQVKEEMGEDTCMEEAAAILQAALDAAAAVASPPVVASPRCKSEDDAALAGPSPTSTSSQTAAAPAELPYIRALTPGRVPPTSLFLEESSSSQAAAAVKLPPGALSPALAPPTPLLDEVAAAEPPPSNASSQAAAAAEELPPAALLPGLVPSTPLVGEIASAGSPPASAASSQAAMAEGLPLGALSAVPPTPLLVSWLVGQTSHSMQGQAELLSGTIQLLERHLAIFEQQVTDVRQALLLLRQQQQQQQQQHRQRSRPQTGLAGA
eukprot:CAMPEP_0115634850 /NCGR_PEP_ID=MMETSP0272-20121206/32803_1 /TAXON_ID=71861 /ORGANISM="Scrippsiella trochoidea, Strain CCMP3099" /LENGTH=464 /DNA_ID=CAMNT_0003071711 /DNA_START=63 /DNA_END=1457 /DNA_ORIENTATION=+